ncbi:protein-tyrosine phosphatase family protein [Pyrobaculum neutrophilum]|uniref:Dual specificity protein phosphatase n=1 Tax=Pyrobaculum neutrophilum (strain DSM 2338 / JCM 9278 / NBRC 100436 / V24Sta) TaxID=444157 RepID=B1YCQ9_PYRNV|nr:protein-tyrosine phosphatase family protein [Pyrobaculum neutrophilum]ACB39572.1 dual specificity protein phosphatase [Pyrobaculum neutrophilum V24Sta]
MGRVECPYWVVENLGGSCMPRRSDVERWISLGVKSVVTLAEAWEIEYYGGWSLPEFRDVLRRQGVDWIHWPTPDGYPPRDLLALVELIDEELRRGPVVVHCVGGMGRTPTALAAYLAAKRCMGADDAIRRVEAVNPAIAITELQYYAILEVEAASRGRCGQGT